MDAQADVGGGLHVPPPPSGLRTSLCLPLFRISWDVPSLQWPYFPVLIPTAWLNEEVHGSSSEDDTDVDVEGLRRRRGREPSTPQPAARPGVEDLAQARGEAAGGELGISLNMWFLGALVLLGLGILLFSGEPSLPCWGLSSGPFCLLLSFAQPPHRGPDLPPLSPFLGGLSDSESGE